MTLFSLFLYLGLNKENVCPRVCLCVYLLHVCMQICVPECMGMYAHRHVCTFCAWTHTYIYIRMQTQNIHTCTHTYLRMYMRMHIHKHTHTHACKSNTYLSICTHMRACKHTISNAYPIKCQSLELQVVVTSVSHN